jgi:hypothetical protein
MIDRKQVLRGLHAGLARDSWDGCGMWRIVAGEVSSLASAQLVWNRVNVETFHACGEVLSPFRNGVH